MSIIIALLMALGLIMSPGDFENLNETQQNEMMEIIILEETAL